MCVLRTSQGKEHYPTRIGKPLCLASHKTTGNSTLEERSQRRLGGGDRGDRKLKFGPQAPHIEQAFSEHGQQWRRSIYRGSLGLLVCLKRRAVGTKMSTAPSLQCSKRASSKQAPHTGHDRKCTSWLRILTSSSHDTGTVVGGAELGKSNSSSSQESAIISLAPLQRCSLVMWLAPLHQLSPPLIAVQTNNSVLVSREPVVAQQGVLFKRLTCCGCPSMKEWVGALLLTRSPRNYHYCEVWRHRLSKRTREGAEIDSEICHRLTKERSKAKTRRGLLSPFFCGWRCRV